MWKRHRDKYFTTLMHVNGVLGLVCLFSAMIHTRQMWDFVLLSVFSFSMSWFSWYRRQHYRNEDSA